MADVRFDAFISYHSGDAAWVSEFATDLQARGLKIWLDADQIRPGDQFVDVLERALEEVQAVLVIVSEGAMRSQWVKQEYERAVVIANKSDLRIVPVLIGRTEVPGFLSTRSWADFRDPSKRSDALERLVAVLQDRVPARDTSPNIDYRSDAAPIDEGQVITLLTERLERGVADLKRYRWLSVIPGVIIGAVLWFKLAGPSPWLMTACVSAPFITLLAGCASLAVPIGARIQRIDQMKTLEKLLQICRGRSIPDCQHARDTFWNVARGEAGMPTVSRN